MSSQECGSPVFDYGEPEPQPPVVDTNVQIDSNESDERKDNSDPSLASQIIVSATPIFTALSSSPPVDNAEEGNFDFAQPQDEGDDDDMNQSSNIVSSAVNANSHRGHKRKSIDPPVAATPQEEMSDKRPRIDTEPLLPPSNTANAPAAAPQPCLAVNIASDVPLAQQPETVPDRDAQPLAASDAAPSAEAGINPNVDSHRRRQAPVAPPLDPSPAELRRQRRRNRPPPAARMCASDLPPIDNENGYDAHMLPVPPASKPVILTQSTAMESCEQQMREFRFPLTHSVKEALNCFPFHNLRAAPTFPSHLRILPLVPLPHTHFADTFSPCDPIHLFHSYFANPLVEAPQWLAIGFRHIRLFMESARRTQQRLMSAFVLSLSPTQLNRDNRRCHRRWIKTQVQYDLHSLLPHLMLDGSQRISTRAFLKKIHKNSSGLYLNLFVRLLRDLHDIHTFLSYLNHFVLSTLTSIHSAASTVVGGIQAAYQPEPSYLQAFTLQHRMEFLLALNEHVLDVVRLATSATSSWTQQADLLANTNLNSLSTSALENAQEFATTVSSLLVSFHVTLHSQILWLYDQQLLRYNLISLRQYQQYFEQAKRAEDMAEVNDQLDDVPPPLQIQDAAYFPFLSYVEHLFHSLLALSHRHPKITATDAEKIDKLEQKFSADESKEEEELEPGLNEAPPTSTFPTSPAVAKSSSSLIHYYHPVTSIWIKLKESLQLFDRCVLYSRDDSLPQLLTQLWFHTANSELAEAFPTQSSTSEGSTFEQQPLPLCNDYLLTPELKLKAIEMYRSALRKKDAESPSLLFWTFMQLTSQQLLQGVKYGTNKSMENLSKDAVGYVNFDKAQQARVIHQAINRPFSSQNDTITEMEAMRSMQQAGLASVALSAPSTVVVSDMSHSSAVDRLETLFDILFQVIVPHVLQFEEFSFPLNERMPRRLHRIVDPLERRFVMAPNNAQSFPSSYSMSMESQQQYYAYQMSQEIMPPIDTLDARPWVLLPMAAEKTTPPPLAVRAGLGPDEFFHLLTSQVDWNLFRGWSEVIESIQVWDSTVLRNQSLIPSTLRHGSTGRFQHYPSLFLSRFLHLQQRVLITPSNQELESNYIRHAVLRSRFLMELETRSFPLVQASSKDRHPARRKKFGVSDLGGELNPAVFSLPSWFTQALTRSSSKFTASALNIQRVDSKSQSSFAVTSIDLSPQDTYFTIALKMIHLHLQRSLRPDAGHWLLVAEDKGATNPQQIADVNQIVHKALQHYFRQCRSEIRLGGLKFVHQMLKKLQKPLVHSNIAFRPLTWTNEAESSRLTPQNSEFFFWHNYDIDQGAARSNLLAFQRRISMLLMMSFTIPTKLPEFITSIPIDVFHVLTHDLFRSRLLENKMKFSPFKRACNYGPSLHTQGNTHDVAEHLLLSAYWLHIHIRQDCFDLESDTLMELQYFKAKNLMSLAQYTSPYSNHHAQPGSHMYNVEMHLKLRLETIQRSWLYAANNDEHTIDPVVECEFNDVFQLLMASFFAPLFDNFMKNELKRLDAAEEETRRRMSRLLQPSSSSNHTFSTTEISMFNQKQDEIKEYLSSILNELHEVVARQKHRWTMNELHILNFNLNNAEGNLSAASAVPVRYLFHELLEVHGSNVRVPFTLRAAALKLVEGLLPSAEWSPAFVPNKIRSTNPTAPNASAAAAAAVVGSSLIDDDDDEAFMDFALPGEQLARAHRLAYDHARRESAERKRIESEYWQQVRELQAEIQAKQRKKYVSQLSAHLQKFVPLLQQLLFSNMHDHEMMKKRVKEIKRFQTNASSALVGVQNHSNQLNQHAVGAPANSFAASVAALASSAAAAAAATVASAPAAVVAIHPLSHHFFPPNEAFLMNIVDVLSICAHVLTAEKVLEWKYVAEHWFPIFLHDEPIAPTSSASHASRVQAVPRSGAQQSTIVVEGTSRVTFSIWDLSSPLKETITLRFYDSLLHPSRFYRGHAATNRAFADSPQLFLLLWLQAMADFDLSSSSATRALTDSILRTREWEWTGSTWYGNLIDFFEPREKVEAWLRRESSQMLSPSTAMHSPNLIFQWFSSKLKAVSPVLKAYARKFSQLRATAYQISATGSVPTSSTNTSTINSSCGLTSIFFKFSALLRHNVKLITEKHASQRGYITTAVRGMYLDFVYAFIGIIMEECSDCLHPRGAMQSISILMSFFDDFMRKEPLGIAHEEMFKASCTSLHSVLLGLENHLATKELDSKRNHLELLSPGFTLRTPLQKLWTDYMHCLLNESFRFSPKPAADPSLIGFYPYVFHASRVPNIRDNNSVEVSMPVLAQSSPLTKETLFEAWRRGLFPLKNGELDARNVSSNRSALQSLRLTQQRLLRRYILSLYVSQALGSAVMVKPGDVRLQFVQQLLDEFVSPLVAAPAQAASFTGVSNRTRLDRTHQHYFMEEFRLLLPSLLSLLFQSRDFLPCFHASTSPMIVGSAKSQLAMFGNAQLNPWIMNRQMLNIRSQVMRILVAASRRCISISTFASLPESSSISCQWFQLFGSAPFTSELPQAKLSGNLFLHLLMQNMLHDIKIILALDNKSVETEVSYVRVQMESGVRTLAASHFRPPPLLAEAHERLMKELPRPNLSNNSNNTSAADNVSVRLFYYDLVKQYFAFFRTIMRVSLEAPGASVQASAHPSSVQPGTESYTATVGKPGAPSTVAPQPAAVAPSAAPPASQSNIWSQAANARSVTSIAIAANATATANIWARPAPSTTATTQPGNIWMKAPASTSNGGAIQASSTSSSAVSSASFTPVEQSLNRMIGLWELATSDSPASGSGATNRAWVETALTLLKELLDPPKPNPKWIQEEGFIRLCDEYLSLLYSLDDIGTRMRLCLSPSLSSKLQAEKAKRKE